MHSHEERRDPRQLRVPLDRVEVELAHEAFDDVFEADGIDVAEGGLALRSAILPDIGARLRCAFSSPVDGASIVADGEVVWAHDSGPHLGEFGVRFDGLDLASEASLRRIIEDHEDRALTQEESDALGWPSSPGTYASPSDDDLDDEIVPLPAASNERDTIALELDGVASELVAEIVHAADDAMLVEQELPFLRLGTGLTTEDGRRGSIEGVELRIEDDVPRLVLTVVFESGGHAVVHEESDIDTMPDAELPFAAAQSRGAAELPGEASEDDDVPVVTRARTLAVTRAPIAVEIATAQVAPKTSPQSAREPSRPGPVKREATETFRIEQDHDDDDVETRGPADHAASAMDALRTQAFPAVAKLFATIALIVKRAYAAVAPRLVEATRIARSRTTHMIAALRTQQRRSTSRPRAETAATPPRRRVQGARNGAEDVPVVADADARKRKNRIVLGLAAGTVLVGAVGLMSEETPATPPVVAAPAPEAVEAEPVVEDAPIALPTQAPMPAAAPLPEQPAVAGGRMEPPTFPTIEAADETTARSITPAPRATSFGAASVPNGMVFDLEMTTAVEAVEGEATATGFRVRLTHANSNSRASPISQQHPDVDRASILNQGENAELRIDFLAGRRPAYRVEAAGRRVRVIIARGRGQ